MTWLPWLIAMLSAGGVAFCTYRAGKSKAKKTRRIQDTMVLAELDNAVRNIKAKFEPRIRKAVSDTRKAREKAKEAEGDELKAIEDAMYARLEEDDG